MKIQLLLFALAAVALAAPQDDVVFHSGVSLVRVDADAVDTTGAVIPGLTKDDFRILDQGVEQKIVNFSFAEEPLDLILLFDVGGGMKGKILELMRATQFGSYELHKDDRICVRVFSSQSTELLPFSSNLEEVNRAIVLRAFTLRPNGPSKLDAAADEAALRFRSEPSTRRKRGILIVTDKPGQGGNRMRIVRDLWNSDAVLSELIMDRPGPTAYMLEKGTDELVDRTGGATIVAGKPGDAFRDSVHYLRSGYTMYYTLPDAPEGSARSLKMELTPAAAARFPNVRIRARSGYLTGQSKPGSRPVAGPGAN